MFKLFGRKPTAVHDTEDGFRGYSVRVNPPTDERSYDRLVRRKARVEAALQDRGRAPDVTAMLEKELKAINIQLIEI